jgi:hypothetical protein
MAGRDDKPTSTVNGPGSRPVHGVHSSDLFGDEAIRVIRGFSGDRLFLYLASQAPHAHFYGAPPRHYRPADVGTESESDVGSESESDVGTNTPTEQSGGLHEHRGPRDGDNRAPRGGGNSPSCSLAGRLAAPTSPTGHPACDRREVTALVHSLDEMVGRVVDALKAKTALSSPAAGARTPGGGDGVRRGAPTVAQAGSPTKATRARQSTNQVQEWGRGRGPEREQQQTMWDDTVFVFSSDNGPEEGTGASAGSFRGWKRQMWEGGLRSVTFASLPHTSAAPATVGGQRQPRRGGRLVGMAHSTDWLRTFGTMAGVPISKLVAASPDGLDLGPQLLLAATASATSSSASMAKEELMVRLEGSPPRQILLVVCDQVLQCGAARTAVRHVTPIFRHVPRKLAVRTSPSLIVTPLLECRRVRQLGNCEFILHY